MKINLLERLGQGQQIIPWLEAASRKDAFNAGLKLLLADHLVKARQFDKAEQILLVMHAKMPETPGLYRGLFQVYKQDAGRGAEKLLQLLNKTYEQANLTRTTRAQPWPRSRRAPAHALCRPCAWGCRAWARN